MPPPYRLSNYPWVVVRLRCNQCNRRGRYRLAKLAQFFGAEELMDNVLYELSKDCRYQRPPGTRLSKYGMRCHAEICDSPEASARPRDEPSDTWGSDSTPDCGV